jgi:hypothetical protein
MQNHPKPDSKLILRPKEDFRDIFQPGKPGWHGPCNQPLTYNVIPGLRGVGGKIYTPAKLTAVTQLRHIFI